MGNTVSTPLAEPCFFSTPVDTIVTLLGHHMTCSTKYKDSPSAYRVLEIRIDPVCRMMTAEEDMQQLELSQIYHALMCDCEEVKHAAV